MKHHILVKWIDGADKDSLRKDAEALFSKLNGKCTVSKVELVPNCIDRPNRYDLLIAITMDKAGLALYDESAEHKQWKADFGKYIQSKAIFDCE